MKKTLITSVTAFAIILSAGMSMAGPLSENTQQTTNVASSGFHVNVELSNSDNCDSCSDAWS
ncbi:hypothetical protein [Ruegeria atlantica]|uniref:hypothetical protein n=1 Tax=Ruegeria atlantica TaxID=81569 RepID=UPI00147FC7F5|nr:hypothetical protein [Ruegeria atlantica]